MVQVIYIRLKYIEKKSYMYYKNYKNYILYINEIYCFPNSLVKAHVKLSFHLDLLYEFVSHFIIKRIYSPVIYYIYYILRILIFCVKHAINICCSSCAYNAFIKAIIDLLRFFLLFISSTSYF